MSILGVDDTLQRFDYTEIIMGVEARVVLYAPDEIEARRAARAAFDRMAQLDAVMSDYRPDSELMRATRAASSGPVAISDDLCRVLVRAQELSEATGGVFDVTIGPLAGLWREARRSGRLPDPDALESARRRVGRELVIIDPDAGMLELTEPGMRLDLGGIGKGFAADEAVAVLAGLGVTRCLVDLGGDIAAAAPPPGTAGWRITLDGDPSVVIELDGRGVATSADTQQFVMIDGTRYSHIVDPRTGLGVTNRLSVTVVAPDAATADALASAVSVLGRDEVVRTRFPQVKVYMTDHAQAPDTRLDWWRAARFGLFIHWGLYAIPAGTWRGRPVGGVGEWIMHHGRIPAAEYETLQGQFNPVRFDARVWARLARRAGMRYVVITTKHHDGFCLFDSAHTDYDIAATPFGRDVMAEIAEAFRGEGLRIGWYHSIMDWHHPDYLPRRPWDERPGTDADLDNYVRHLRSQVTELLTRYGPIDIMWFDGEWEETWTHEHGRALYDLVRGLQADVIVNNRVDKGRGGMEGLTRTGDFAGDFGTPEQQVPATGLPGVAWETCMTMNDSWGYKTDDDNWKSAGDLIRTLVDVASKGGNFLLNVGPTALGEIPAASVERLEAIGRWLDTNGESIYGTSASPFESLPWGRCTQKADHQGATRLYLHVFDPPPDGTLLVPDLANDIRRAYRLADRTPLAAGHDRGGVIVRLPPPSPGPVTVVVLDIDGPPAIAPHHPRLNDK